MFSSVHPNEFRSTILLVPAADFTQLEDELIFDEWRTHRSAGKRSLTRAGDFAAALGVNLGSHPVPTLGVVGSKGKGTAAIYASAALAAHGLRVGTVTSPGLLANRDRIRINGQALPGSDYLRVIADIARAKKQLPPVGADRHYLSPTGTFILGGVNALIGAGCDVLVVEAGMGGASDELSLLPLDIVVVTAIFGEHLDVLGPTVGDVVRDKIGVITARTAGVISVHQTDPVQREVSRACARAGVPLLARQPEWSAHLADLLPPGHGAENALAGIHAAAALLATGPGRTLDLAALRPVLASLHYPGRLSVHQLAQGRLVLDTAVSRAGLTTAMAFARRTFGQDPARILVSLPVTKDIAGFVTALQRTTSERVFVNLEHEHLPYPASGQWPWRWLDERDMDGAVLSGNVLAAGTVSFISSLMRRVGVDGERLFTT